MLSRRSSRRMSISPALQQVMELQIDSIREKIIDYTVLPVRDEQRYIYDSVPNHIDILLFGPAGAGKTSLIKTFFRSLHAKRELPEQVSKLLTIKSKVCNEGTTHYSQLVLKPFGEDIGAAKEHRIVVHDTRGQMWGDEREFKQLQQIISGKVRDRSLVEQRNFRYAKLLWEFWKRDTDLFPQDILVGPSLATKPHSLVFVFDGSMDEIPNSPEEVQFYKDILAMARGKNYLYPQVVLTCLDKVEQQIEDEQTEKLGRKMNDFERDKVLNLMVEAKIEKIVLTLGISKSQVHIIENFKTDDEEDPLWRQDERNKLTINYKALKLLHECTLQAENFLLSQVKERGSGCNIL